METDILVIGAGAAGLMCAIEAGKRGRSTVVIDHAKAPAEKIRISGGGRCNFTNRHASPKQFLSRNPHFCVSALSRYSAQDFIALVESHKIAYHEKTLGQLFCDGSSKQIIAMLLEECARAKVRISLETSLQDIRKSDEYFRVATSQGSFKSQSLVVACGGLSIPKMGASKLGYDIAKQFGHPIVPTAPALVPFTLPEMELQRLQGLSGVAVEGTARIGKQAFREGILFTHRGLSGPATLQISSYWEPGVEVTIDLAPDRDGSEILLQAKKTHPKQEAATVLSQFLPKRLAQIIAGPAPARLADLADKRLAELGDGVNRWRLVPGGTEGYRTAEVTIGGVDTAMLSSRTMESGIVPGLYFIGEVVDVTGHLGGFNFQWAWSSGHAAGQCA